VVAGLAVVRVRGASMQPTLEDGDVLIVRVGAEPAPGRLVVVRLPGRDGLAVKRVLREEPEGWWVERDNPRVGTDSWVTGAVPASDIVAQVVGRLWPPRRIGAPPAL
jgi:phage repressor protein C with HTH and peptisase S24 domain